MAMVKANHRLGLLKLAVWERSKNPSAQGAYKRMWKVRIGSKEWALKRADGGECEDCVREVLAQKLHLKGQPILRHVAWGWVDGYFYTLQPYAPVVAGIRETKILRARLAKARVFDVFASNARIYKGRAVCSDWGYFGDEYDPLPVCYEEDTLRWGHQ